MAIDYCQRLEQLEKRVAALERQLAEQPEFVPSCGCGNETTIHIHNLDAKGTINTEKLLEQLVKRVSPC